MYYTSFKSVLKYKWSGMKLTFSAVWYATFSPWYLVTSNYSQIIILSILHYTLATLHIIKYFNDSSQTNLSRLIIFCFISLNSCQLVKVFLVISCSVFISNLQLSRGGEQGLHSSLLKCNALLVKAKGSLDMCSENRFSFVISSNLLHMVDKEEGGAWRSFVNQWVSVAHHSHSRHHCQ